MDNALLSGFIADRAVRVGDLNITSQSDFPADMLFAGSYGPIDGYTERATL